jgi:Flp pilus assembly protein TadD
MIAHRPRAAAPLLPAVLAALTTLVALSGCAGATPGAGDPSTAPGPATAAPAHSGGAKPPAAAEPTAELADAEAAIKANDGAKAQKAAEAALAKAPKNPKALFFAALAHELQGDKPAAEKRYREALAVAPGFADAAVNLSAILLDTERGADAVALLKPLAAKAPDDPLLQANYAVALSASGDHAQSAAVYAKLVAKGDTNPETRLGYAGELIAAGKKEDAAKVLRDGVAQAGENRDLYAAFGRALAKAGAFDDAVKALDKAIAIKATPDLLTYRALFKRSLKDLPGARADLEAANKADPKFAQAYVYLGEVLEEQKKPADAKKAYEKAIELAGDTGPGKRARERLDAMKGKKLGGARFSPGGWRRMGRCPCVPGGALPLHPCGGFAPRTPGGALPLHPCGGSAPCGAAGALPPAPPAGLRTLHRGRDPRGGAPWFSALS